VELCTELFYAIIPTLFLWFLLICYPLHLVTFLMFFILVQVTFFLAADAYLSRSLSSITEQQVSPHRLSMQYWLKNHRGFLIQQSCVIIHFVA